MGSSFPSGFTTKFLAVSETIAATTATTLTSTPTLLSITPASYGVAVTLPDATTCSLGGPLHIIDNKGVYPVKVLNNGGTLLGFVLGGVVSHISLVAKANANGTWTVENSELVGVSAQLATTKLDSIQACIALDSDREFILGQDGADSTSYAVVYQRSTNTFGAVTQIRNAAVGTRQAAVLQASGNVLIVSCTATTGFEAVVCTTSGTTITVGTAGTATLSANISAFADGCELIAVGTSFVTSYTVASPAAQLREITPASPVTNAPTISAATVLDGTAGGLIIAADATHVIAVSTATTHIYTKPYALPGLGAGTGTDDTVGTATVNKLGALGTRWAMIYLGGTAVAGGIISFNSGTNTTTTSVVAGLLSTGGAVVLGDAIVVGSDRVFVTGQWVTDNANILIDTAGTASKGTAIALTGDQMVRPCLYSSGTKCYTHSTQIFEVECAGSSAVGTAIAEYWSLEWPYFSASNAMFSRSPNAVFGATYARNIKSSAATQNFDPVVRGGNFETALHQRLLMFTAGTNYRGSGPHTIWGTDAAAASSITKVECVP